MVVNVNNPIVMYKYNINAQMRATQYLIPTLNVSEFITTNSFGEFFLFIKNIIEYLMKARLKISKSHTKKGNVVRKCSLQSQRERRSSLLRLVAALAFAVDAVLAVRYGTEHAYFLARVVLALDPYDHRTCKKYTKLNCIDKGYEICGSKC